MTTDPVPRTRLIDDVVLRHRGNPNFQEHDAEGFRQSYPAAQADILLTGSSHVYGINLLPQYTWPHLLLQKDMKIYNASMSAWGFMQFCQVTEKYLQPQHRRLVLGFYSGFDVYATVRHVVETNNQRGMVWLSSAGAPQPPSWRDRTDRDAFLKAAKEAGRPQPEALEEAAAKGMKDVVKVSFAGQDWWLEPELRTITQNLEAPYIQAGVRLARNYLDVIAACCRTTGTRLSIAIMPTKEFVIGSAVPEADRPASLARMMSLESQVVAAVAGHAARGGADMLDLRPILIREAATGVYSSEPFEGHPSAHGARVIADAASAAWGNPA